MGMTESEKVISILSKYKNFSFGDKDKKVTVDEIIALLKAQEPVSVQKKHMEMDGFQTWDWVCGNCGQMVLFSARFCPWCGRAVKWE